LVAVPGGIVHDRRRVFVARASSSTLVLLGALGCPGALPGSDLGATEVPAADARLRRDVKDPRLFSDEFPRASAYHPDWVIEGASGGANALWLTEWLSEALVLEPGMRVLDLGCGRASSSIFLHREFGVQVWATDLSISTSENARRIAEAGITDGVVPVQADARALPFAEEFFDVVVSIDAFSYFGTDDDYLGHLARFVKPGGQIAIAGAGLIHELEGPVPEHLRGWWAPSTWSLHSAPWWRHHWEETGLVTVEVADAMPNGWRSWLGWQRIVSPDNAIEIAALEADAGRTLGYVRMVARRRPGVHLDAPLVSLHEDHEPRVRPASDDGL
jgi:SAM-dependent methyltransferase